LQSLTEGKMFPLFGAGNLGGDKWGEYILADL